MKKKTILFIVLILLCLGFGAYRFLYHGHRDVTAEDASYTVTVAQLAEEFKSNTDAANKKYADKVIEVSGKITAADAAANSIMVDEKLSAILKDKAAQVPGIGSAVKLKGRFVGFDDLLEELKLDQVTLDAQ